MGVAKLIIPRGSVVNKRQLPMILIIAVCWTLIDLLMVRMSLLPAKNPNSEFLTKEALTLRELNVFIMSFFIGFLLVSVLRKYFHSSSLWINLIVKTSILLVAAVAMNLFIYMTYELIINGRQLDIAFNRFVTNTFRPEWAIPRMTEWIILFLLTQLALEINEKYSPGVFVSIMVGRYLQPKEEERILIFIDLRNSTPIAEKLGNKYFPFIRDFIFCISAGIMEHDGRIYQYVGDEIVAWWPSSKRNAKKAIQSLIESRKVLNINTAVFNQNYDIQPEYKAGMHVGKVTVGQVGIAKKELVMSGDTINTASRIRSACNDLNQKFLVSKDIVDMLDLPEWQSESMGNVDLKGKNNELELFALKI
jgi:adenylate cyclase